MTRPAVLLTALLLAGCASETETPADLVLENGHVVTVNPEQPEAEAIAIRGDRVLAVGSNDAIDRDVTDATEIIDLEGETVVPDLIDAHVHLVRKRRAIELAIDECLASGLTSVHEAGGFRDDIDLYEERMEPGKLADLVVLSKDIITVPAPEIFDTEFLTTILGGKVVFEK